MPYSLHYLAYEMNDCRDRWIIDNEGLIFFHPNQAKVQLALDHFNLGFQEQDETYLCFEDWLTNTLANHPDEAVTQEQLRDILQTISVQCNLKSDCNRVHYAAIAAIFFIFICTFTTLFGNLCLQVCMECFPGCCCAIIGPDTLLVAFGSSSFLSLSALVMFLSMVDWAYPLRLGSDSFQNDLIMNQQIKRLGFIAALISQPFVGALLFGLPSMTLCLIEFLCTVPFSCIIGIMVLMVNGFASCCDINDNLPDDMYYHDSHIPGFSPYMF